MDDLEFSETLKRLVSSYPNLVTAAGIIDQVVGSLAGSYRGSLAERFAARGIDPRVVENHAVVVISKSTESTILNVLAFPATYLNAPPSPHKYLAERLHKSILGSLNARVRHVALTSHPDYCPRANSSASPIARLELPEDAANQFKEGLQVYSDQLRAMTKDDNFPRLTDIIAKGFDRLTSSTEPRPISHESIVSGFMLSREPAVVFAFYWRNRTAPSEWCVETYAEFCAELNEKSTRSSMPRERTQDVSRETDVNDPQIEAIENTTRSEGINILESANLTTLEIAALWVYTDETGSVEGELKGHEYFAQLIRLDDEQDIRQAYNRARRIVADAIEKLSGGDNNEALFN